MATIKEIAELAGVSRRTVDRVINHRGSVKPDTEEKIRKIIEELSYTPNAAGRSLAAHKKKLRLLFCSTKGTYAPLIVATERMLLPYAGILVFRH